MTDLTEFHALAAEANRVDSSLFEYVEPQYAAVLDYCWEHPELRPELAKEFVALAFDSEHGSSNMVMFCMHELKWTEVRDVFAVLLENEKSARARFFIKGILASFDDDWRLAHLYQRFGGDP